MKVWHEYRTEHWMCHVERPSCSRNRPEGMAFAYEFRLLIRVLPLGWAYDLLLNYHESDRPNRL